MSDVWTLAACFWALHNGDMFYAICPVYTKSGDSRTHFKFKSLTWSGSEPLPFKKLIERCFSRITTTRPTIDQLVNSFYTLWGNAMNEEEKSPMQEGGKVYKVGH